MNLPTNISNSQLPATYQAAKTALAECHRVDECKDWSDKAAALAVYAKQAEDYELEKTAARIRGRAIRRAGELLAQIDRPETGGRPKNGEGDRTVSSAAREAGMSKHQQIQATRIANVPEDQFEEMIEADKPATVTQMAEAGKKTTENAAKHFGLPEDYLKGLTGKQFNQALHLSGDIARYAKELHKWDIEVVPSWFDESQITKVRQAIAEIEEAHRKIKKRIGL